MPTRFLLLWIVVSVVVYSVVFVMTRRDRRTAWKFWKRVAISIFGGAVVVLPLFFLNNISGV